MDVRTLAAILLLVVPLAAWVMAGHPALIPVWSAERERHLAIIGAHRTAWTFLNAAFAIATIATTAGLGVLVIALGDDAVRAGVLTAVAAVYAVAGGLWCAVLAIRARTTPTLADHVARGAATEPGEALIGAALGGLFAAFALLTATVLVVLGLTLLLAGGVAAPIALIAALIAAAVLVGQLVTGDSVPAILYVPTQLIGLALLLGWT